MINILLIVFSACIFYSLIGILKRKTVFGTPVNSLLGIPNYEIYTGTPAIVWSLVSGGTILLLLFFFRDYIFYSINFYYLTLNITLGIISAIGIYNFVVTERDPEYYHREGKLVKTRNIIIGTIIGISILIALLILSQIPLPSN